jgi:hypothetical protein
MEAETVGVEREVRTVPSDQNLSDAERVNEIFLQALDLAQRQESPSAGERLLEEELMRAAADGDPVEAVRRRRNALSLFQSMYPRLTR